MTAAQRAELKAQLEAEERAEKQKREESIAAYKSSVDEFCRSKFSRLQALSEEMRRLKEEVFGDAETLIALKDELFRTKSDRHSNQFTTSDGKITVALGYRTNDGWDDTVNVGVDKVKTFIKSLAKDEDSAALTEMVMNLLAKDRKGNLKASRVLQLREIARKSGYPQLIEATDIIQNAYRPVDTCQFISVSYKDDKGVKQTLPLSLAAMGRLKEEVFGDAETLIALKDELFRTKSDRHSNQFTTSDGKITVALGYRTNDGWDDTVNVGVDKVKTFIKSLAKDEDSAALTEMVMNLLAKDRKGNLKASRVLQLREIARKSGYPQLIEATDIIQNAYRPVDTCQFISVSYKDDKGVKQTLPLSLAAME